MLDMRLEAYRHNCDRVPSIAGHVVPEWVATPAQYQKNISSAIYRDLETLDPDEVLKDEWVKRHSERFNRQTIKMPRRRAGSATAPILAILQFIVAILKALVAKTSPSASRTSRWGIWARSHAPPPPNRPS